MDDTGGEVVARLAQWANEQALIRTLLLTSSRASPNAPVDRLSDYDVVAVVADLRPFTASEAWVRAYGSPLVVFRDWHATGGVETQTRLVLYDDGTKIDYCVWPVEMLRRVSAEARLPDNLDVGYRVLVDKDALADGLKPPTYTAHIPRKPTEEEYLALVEEFWWETSYVAKNLWRGELFPAKYSFDVVIKLDRLRRMLEWHVETGHNWSLRPGAVGRGLRKALEPEIWTQVESTFVGADLEENWEALFRTTAVFREVASTVAARLGYEYPLDMDRRMTSYLAGIRSLPR